MMSEAKLVTEEFERIWLERVSKLYGGHETIFKACQYSLVGTGKRARPTILMLTAKSLGCEVQGSISAAMAHEMLHTYSLVHDDLPSMDNDDFRRGRLSTHKRFTEGIAVLAGDALLTDAISLICEDLILSDRQKVAILTELSKSSGSKGMIFGQSLDLESSLQRECESPEFLNSIHLAKTGALFGSSLACGAICAGRFEIIDRLKEVGAAMGLAFQIIDDLMDASPLNGKTPGKDLIQNKLTYLKFYSPSEARSIASDLTEKAKSILEEFGILHHLGPYFDELLIRKG
jgi:geranylgeranyl diphosphate synthase type II